ncbi:serine hydrolase domain-containing protein [Microbacterium album]|uniref:Beta-lactamase n=1 Tax=Microbacterium album TaxID=2053191 RepID=A0A917MQ25_9MICO|nr:serine hydrolase domain-containing protein [Microbacterium album]GGH49826.1 beta-lactamase [Microbacterium album]
MRTRPVAAAAFLLAVALVSGCAPDGAPSPPSPTAQMTPAWSADEVRDIVQRALDGTGIPGAAVRVEDGSGAGVTVVTGDAAPGRPVAEDTRFSYRSVTKAIVGTVALQLADEGVLRLDAPVADYVDGVPGGEEIVVEDLATMRSGLADYATQQDVAERFLSDPAYDPSAAELLEIAFAHPPLFAPGTSYHYSNTNTVLLGEIIERASGVPWPQAVEEHVARPLGLGSLAYPEGSTSPDMALGHLVRSDGSAEALPDTGAGWFGAAGGLVGSADDLARWARALGTGELVSADTHERRLETLAAGQGYGFAIAELEGWIGHLGSAVGYESLALYEPEGGRVVAVLLNGTGPQPNLPAAVFHDLLAAWPA